MSYDGKEFRESMKKLRRDINTTGNLQISDSVMIETKTMEGHHCKSVARDSREEQTDSKRG